jgi:hypothetical protein
MAMSPLAGEAQRGDVGASVQAAQKRHRDLRGWLGLEPWILE